MRRLSTNALFIFGADVGARALNFLAVVYLVRVLDQANWGRIVVGMACLTYAQWLADFGLTTLGTRELAKPRDRREFQLGDLLALRMLLAVAVWLVAQIPLALIALDPQLRAIIQIYLASLIANALFLEWYFQSIQDFRLLIVSRVVSAVIYLLPVYLIVKHSADVVAVPWIYLFTSIVTSALLFLWKRKEDSLLPERGRAGLAAIMRRASIIGMGSFFGQTIMVLPPLAVAWIVSDAAAGVLGATIKVVTLLLMVDRIFAPLFLPAVTRKWLDDPEGMAAALLPAIKVLTVVGCSLSVVVSIFAADILHLIFGASYSGDGALILSILGWFVTATLMNTFFMYGLIGIGRETPFLSSSIKGGLLFATLLVVMTYFWGVPGAALAMVVSEFAFTALLSVAFTRYVPLRFGRYLLLYLAVSAIAIGLARLVGPEGIWQLPLWWLAFVGTIYLCKGLRRNEIAWLTSR